MEKTITTALLVIASIVATMALINAVIPAAGKGSGALIAANSDAADRIKTDIEIVFASGNSTGDEITFWVKNVGSNTINAIDNSDIFLTSPTAIIRIPYDGGGSPTKPYWKYTVEGSATNWSQAVTTKIEVFLTSGETGLHTVKMAVYNAVTAEKEFSI